MIVQLNIISVNLYNDKCVTPWRLRSTWTDVINGETNYVRQFTYMSTEMTKY